MVTSFTIFRDSNIYSFHSKSYSRTIVGFITQSKSIKFTMKKFAVYVYFGWIFASLDSCILRQLAKYCEFLLDPYILGALDSQIFSQGIEYIHFGWILGSLDPWIPGSLDSETFS